jgi:hypothetical protein
VILFLSLRKEVNGTIFEAASNQIFMMNFKVTCFGLFGIPLAAEITFLQFAIIIS